MAVTDAMFKDLQHGGLMKQRDAFFLVEVKAVSYSYCNRTRAAISQRVEHQESV